MLCTTQNKNNIYYNIKKKMGKEIIIGSAVALIAVARVINNRRRNKEGTKCKSHQLKAEIYGHSMGVFEIEVEKIVCENGSPTYKHCFNKNSYKNHCDNLNCTEYENGDIICINYN